MRINGLCWRNAVLPLFLHFGVHDEQRVVWKVDCDLAFCIGFFLGFLLLFGGFFLRNDSADSELSCYSQRDGADDSSRTEVGELIAMISYTFCAASITIHESSIWLPWIWRLILEFLATWVEFLDPNGDFFVDSFLYSWRRFS